MRTAFSRIVFLAGMCTLLFAGASFAQSYLDNDTQYSNQDPETETRRSTHFRECFGHYNRDGANVNGAVGMTEQLAQGHIQMFEHMWDRWVTELGMHNINTSPSHPEMGLRKANFNFLMTWNDGGGGGAFMSADSNGYPYCMSNAGNCRYDPPSGATPHEMGHVWEGTCGGFNGTDSSGSWWECTANWMMLQFNNGYPQAGGLLYNSMYYPCHGRDYYDTWTIWEAARDDSRYGVQWVNSMWTNYTPDQQAHEYILDRMVRLDTSGSADKAGAMRDLWGDMAKKCITWDYDRHQWLVAANGLDDGSDWNFYQRCRTPLVKIAGTNSYRPERSHTPMEYGFDMIPLSATAGTTVTCNFRPACDPVRQSDWRACLVAVNSNGESRYSTLWNDGSNSITLSNDESKLYLVVIATPKPMKISDPVWNAYMQDCGLQFPYVLTFSNATPKNVLWPTPSGVTWKTHANADGSSCTHIASGATVDSTTYVGPNAMVLDKAQVKSYARIEDYAVVRNSAQVRDYAVVSGHAVVQDNAQVYGNAKVRDWARVFGYAEVYDNAKVIEHANCGDGNTTTHNKVFGNATVKGTTYIYDTSTFQGCLIVDGDSANGNGAVGASGYVVADHGVHFGWQWGENPSIFTNLTDNGYVYAQHDFERDNPVFAMDKYGINHGFLMNGCKAGVDAGRGGLVLPLNGTNQYVELHNSVNDFRETAYTIWVKWTGSASDQRIWSMGDGSSKYMYVTPKDGTTGNLRFAISNGTTTQYLNGTAPLGTGWTHIAVTFGNPVFNTTTKTWSATGTLYVNGTQVATSAGMITPDVVNAALMENANYIGRGNSGNYFAGCVDDFRAYMKTLTPSDISSLYNMTLSPSTITIDPDTTAPTPNAETWLVNPTAISDSAITMSATPGTDDSGWVEYYFDCTSGGGHDSGWVSFNKYTDVGIAPGTACTYTVKMRDKAGNTTGESAAVGATTQVSSMAGITASFAYGPIGIYGTSTTNGQIKMTATKLTSPSGLVEYKFDTYSSTGTLQTAGSWQSSPNFTVGSLNFNNTYYYRVTARDGRGNVSAQSASSSAQAKDMAAPIMVIPVAQWTTQPYQTLTNTISMTATAASDANAVQYQFHCVSGGLADSAWQSGATYTTAAVADGTYTFQYRVKDSAGNTSGYSTTSSVTVSPLHGYHSYTLSQLAGLPDDYLVSFSGTVMRAYANYYMVKDLSSGASIIVKGYNGKTDGTSVEITDPTLALKNVTVKGHLWTLSGVREVTYSTLTATGSPTTYTISGKVTNTLGTAVSGATVYLSDTSNASATYITTATTDASGNYSKAVTSGTWYLAAGSTTHRTSADQMVTVTNANISNINFSLVPNANITGKVTKQSDGTAISGATVYFSPNAGASNSPTFTTTTDASGNYSQPVPNGVWYVAAGGSGYWLSVDRKVTVNDANVPNINFVLRSSTRNIPRTADLLFSAVTESLGANGAAISSWPTYIPSGQNLTGLGNPTVNVLSTLKWDHNLNADGDGFRQATYASPIAVNGASIFVVVKPARSTSNPWNSVVDIFYDKLGLGVMNDTGYVVAARNGTRFTSTYSVPDGQLTILSMVAQPDGTYRVWANGNGAIINSLSSTLTSLVPGASPANAITVGRYNSDTTTTFNGEIGDIFVYKAALTDAERQQLEADLYNKYMTYTITASSGNYGSISPRGATSVEYNGSQTFTMTPTVGGYLVDVKVDNVSKGPITTYTFSNVTNGHIISATFAAQTFGITASAGAGGSVTPDGTTTVDYGSSQTYTITPNSGHSIVDVQVDGISQGAITSYTFNNVTAAHTISATFSLSTCTITASAGANGWISPEGDVVVDYGSNQTFAITANPGSAIYSVVVDGVNQGAISTYTFSNVTTNHTITTTFVDTVSSIAELKAQDPDSLVKLMANEFVIYAPKNSSNARTTTWFYIGEAKGLGGLKVVDKTSDTLTLGNKITSLTGYVRKPDGGEVYLELTANPTGSGNTPIPPLGMTNRTILTDPHALTNAVVVWGKVKSVNGTTSFTINDGYSANVTVNVNGVALPTGFDTTKTAIVIGVLSADGTIQAQSVRAVP